GMAQHEVSSPPSPDTGGSGPLDASGAVLAAVHGSPVDSSVVDWAADEAVRLGVPLRLVSVVDPGFQLMPYEALVSATPSLSGQLEEGAKVLLDDAAGRARGRHPDLDVAVAVAWGSPAAAVLDLAQAARRLV